MPAGTWNLPDIRKTVPFRGIFNRSTIQIFDTTPTSDNYFNIVDFPERFTAGKNLFKLNAANNTLVNDSEVQIEILDFNGNPIYFEPLNYLEQDGTRVISVYIYPDTSPGLATIYITGRARFNVFEDPILQNPLPFSETPSGGDLYKNYPNLLWTRTINIAPEKFNTSEIIFTQQPQVTVVERVVNYQQPITLNNVNISKAGGGGTITIEDVPSGTGAQVNAGTVNSIYQGGTSGTIRGEGQASSRTPLASYGPPINLTGIFTGTPPTLNINSNSSIISTLTAPRGTGGTSTGIGTGTGVGIGSGNVPSSQTSTGITALTGFSRMTTVDFPLSSSMEGGTIVVKNPTLEMELGTALSGSFAIAVGDIQDLGRDIGTFPPDSISQEGSNVELSGSIVFVINEVETPTQAKVSQIAGPGHNAPILTPFNVTLAKSSVNRLRQDGTLESPVAYDVREIKASTEFTSSHTEPLVFATTPQSQSFAEVVLSNIEPATGDIHRIRTSYKPLGQFGDFVSAGETVLERLELLEDTGSFEGTVAIGQIYNRMGYFTNLSDFNTYFQKISSTGFIDTTPAFEPEILINSIKLPNAEDYDSNNNKLAVGVQLKDVHSPEVKKNSTYSIRFRLKCVSGPSSSDKLQYPDSNINKAEINKARFDVYIKGSKQGSIKPAASNFTSYRLTKYDIAETLVGDLIDDGNLGKHVGIIEMEPTSLSFNSIRDVLFTFASDIDQNISINLVQRAGVFAIKDLGITSDAETGFSPNHARLNIRIPSEFIDLPMSFKFEFFDYLGTKADNDVTVYPIKFTGDNDVIAGTNNLITGSIFVGNSIGSGIEIAGVSSGFIRSVGYDGFTSASDGTGFGGFLMYTGSVLPDGPDNYTGVGLEIIQDSGSFLRFATADVSNKPAGLDVRTPRFFFGGDDNFISGSDGKIEISSSNFHLANTGDVVMQGTITAEAGGTIGGFTIGADNLTATNFVLNTTDKKLSLGSGNNIFIADADDGIQLGHATFASAPFNVNLSGAMTASNANITGKISATSGDIGGFSIDTATISSSNNNLILKSSGQITASDADISGKISATSGDIGGFSIDAATISSSNDNLILKSSGQITASDANISGKISATSGDIGGFSIDTATVSSSNNNLILRSSGEITASAADISGKISATSGDIGGFSIDTATVSSSNNNLILRSNGQITASAAQISGKITATSGEIGGFTIGSDNLTATNFVLNTTDKKISLGSSNNIFIADADDGIQLGHATFASAPFSVTTAGALKAESGTVAGWTIDDSSIQKIDSNGGIVINSDDPSIQFRTGSGAAATIIKIGDIGTNEYGIVGLQEGTNNEIFKLGALGNEIAGWEFTNNAIRKFDSNGGVSITSALRQITFRTGSNSDTTILTVGNLGSNQYGIQALDSTDPTKTVFKLGENGNEIAGWTIDDEKFTGGNMIIRKDGTIESSNFASNVAGSGFRLTAAQGGFLEVENARIRGTLATTTFEKESVSAVGGQLYIANSTTLTSSAVAPQGIHSESMATMSVVNVTGFAADEIITAKKVSSTGFATEYMLVESASRADASSDTDFSGFLFVRRGYSGSAPASSGSLGDLASSAQSYSGSQTIVSTGKIGTGYIRLNANPNDPTTPYIDIVERTGSAIYDVDLKARLGDLSGVADSVGGRDVSGFGLYTDNAFLKGGIVATYGQVGGFGISATTISSSNNNLILRNDGKITGSDVLFTSGEIGGFELSSDEIKSSNNNLRLKANGQITASAAQITGKITAQEGTIGGFTIGSDNLTATNFILNTTNKRLTLGSSNNIFIADADDGIQLGHATFASAPFSVTLAGALKATNADISGKVSATSGDIGGFSIDSATISSSNDNIILRSSGEITASDFLMSGGKITDSVQILGSVSANSLLTPATIGGSAATEANASSSISATGFAKFVSASIGGFVVNTTQVKSSNDNLILASDGTITASDARLEGHISASTGTLGGWTIADGKLGSVGIAPNVYRMALDGANLRLHINQTTFGSGTGISLEYNGGTPRFFAGKSGNHVKFDGTNLIIASDNFNIDSSGNVDMEGTVTATAGSIGGFSIDSTTISSSNNNIILKSSGEITASDIQISGGTITDGIQIGGRGAGTVIYFDDFTTYASAAAMTASGIDHKTDGTGQGYYAFQNDNPGFVQIQSGSVGPTFNNNGVVLSIGDDSAGEQGDELWIVSNNLIPINSSSLYEIEVRLRKTRATGGTDGQYAGATLFNSDGITKNSLADPSDSYGSQHYFTLSNTSIGTTYETHRGYVKGFVNHGSLSPGGQHTNKLDPGLFNSGSEGGFFAPTFIANFNGQQGDVELDYIKVTEFAQGGGGTRLSGNSIQTGIIQSSNFSDTSGSRINLNDGTINFGGSSGSSFAVDAAGAVTASNALIEGEVIAANLTEKYIVVTDANSGSFLRVALAGGSGSALTRASDGAPVKNLVFDGSLGGTVCMHMEISCSQGFQVNDIELPFTGSALAAGNVYIQTPDMTFDDQVVQPTFQLLLKSFQTGILLGGSSRNEQLVPFE